jgi:23S rRNA (cytidine1920-2'-O)/16S rRNA (cytidine1409-2'-O)-methyltransferase
VLDATCACLTPGADVVALVKPQFELGRGRVGKGGIVRDPALWDDVLEGLVTFTRERALGPASIARSALPGASGNVEFFLHLRPGADPAAGDVLDTLRHEAVRAGKR